MPEAGLAGRRGRIDPSARLIAGKAYLTVRLNDLPSKESGPGIISVFPLAVPSLVMIRWKCVQSPSALERPEVAVSVSDVHEFGSSWCCRARSAGPPEAASHTSPRCAVVSAPEVVVLYGRDARYSSPLP